MFLLPVVFNTFRPRGCARAQMTYFLNNKRMFVDDWLAGKKLFSSVDLNRQVRDWSRFSLDI